MKGNYYADPSKGFDQFDEMIARKQSGEDDIKDLYGVDTIKFFMEGSGAGFYMIEPFEKAMREAAGLPEDLSVKAFWDNETVAKAFHKLNMAGLQIHTHAMVDGAVR